MPSNDNSGAVSRLPLRVFLVEDSPIIRARLIESIGASGRLEVIGYADTEQGALESLRNVHCDAVVLDLQLREGNGFNVLKALRPTLGQRLTIIVFTNYSLPQFQARSTALGADYFFDKGRESDRVCEVLDQLALTDGPTTD